MGCGNSALERMLRRTSIVMLQLRSLTGKWLRTEAHKVRKNQRRKRDSYHEEEVGKRHQQIQLSFAI